MKTEKLQYGIARYKTPLYIFDLDILRKETERFRNCLGEKIGLCFAMKANPFLTEQMSHLTDRIEICSAGEFEICKELEIPPEKMLISGVLKKKEEITKILEYCGGRSVYTVESMNQFYTFAEWSDANSKVLHVYLRLSSGNQFGMDEKTIRKIIRMRDICPFVKIDGIHYFSGTQKKSLDYIKKELAYLDDFLAGLEEEEQFAMKELEFGPGIAVSYFKGEKDTVFLDESIKELQEAVLNMRWKGHVTFEMGRALASECGYYLTEIRDLKRTGEENYCIVDGGCHQMNYDGQIKGMYQPRMRLYPEREENDGRLWTVCGALCTVNDVLCRNVPLGNIEVGDIIVFERAGAYCVTEGMALFLSHALAQVVLYEEKAGWKVSRKKQPTYRWNM